MTIRARPTIYKGIQMRSRLEALFASTFDHLGWKWEYEPRAYASTAGQYLPDFLVDWPSKGSTEIYPMYVETKGGIFNGQEIQKFLKRMEIILESEPDARLLLVLDTMGLALERGLTTGKGDAWVFHDHYSIARP
jgi:hypothetical protein